MNLFKLHVLSFSNDETIVFILVLSTNARTYSFTAADQLYELTATIRLLQ